MSFVCSHPCICNLLDAWGSRIYLCRKFWCNFDQGCWICSGLQTCTILCWNVCTLCFSICHSFWDLSFSDFFSEINFWVEIRMCDLLCLMVWTELNCTIHPSLHWTHNPQARMAPQAIIILITLWWTDIQTNRQTNRLLYIDWALKTCFKATQWCQGFDQMFYNCCSIVTCPTTEQH